MVTQIDGYFEAANRIIAHATLPLTLLSLQDALALTLSPDGVFLRRGIFTC